MATETWYQTNQMKLFALRVSPEMLKQINDEASDRGLSKKDFYRAMLVAFLPNADQVSYLASYKSPDACVVRFWMDKDIYDHVVDVAKKHNVSLTSACHTAFLHYFNHKA